MTAASPEPADTDDLSARARAERLLARIADHGEKLLNTVDHPLNVPSEVLAILVQAAAQLAALPTLDPPQPARVDVVLDCDDNPWVWLTGDKYQCRRGDEVIATLAEIETRHGIAHEFVAAPRSPG